MNLAQLLDRLRDTPGFMENVGLWRTTPPQEPSYGPWPGGLDPRLVDVLKRRGIIELYCHQAEAVARVLDGENVVVVTPTASGKTLCYNLPVLNALLGNDETRALYLFPTKALSQDQSNELHELVTDLGVDIKAHTYDGDTPATARRAIRQAGHIVVTNPDMLHTGILPHHTKWVRLFENLRYVVIDELHHYRGVFGSHLANVVRRLRRICEFYGSDPAFVMCSATIANPRELAERTIGEGVSLVDNNGAPRGSKHFIFYNPPVVNAELGIRKSSVQSGEQIGSMFIANDIQTIVFARSRTRVEVILSALKEAARRHHHDPDDIRGYRGGYLPLERREIERGLRDGSVRGVVSTNALELGIDIGSLEASIMVGYPGSIASTWQQAGRAGRGDEVSMAMLIASSSPLDQYIVNHPDYFFGMSPEQGLINPENLFIMVSHLKCAAFELPFVDQEPFGGTPVEEILAHLEQEGMLHHTAGQWYWTGETFPAEEVSLRSPTQDNVVIIDETHDARVIGEVDTFSAMMLVHEEAIYIHEGQQYQVERLDYEEKKAFVRAVDVDYYTDANLAVQLKVLTVEGEGEDAETRREWGDVSVTALVTIYKKLKLDTLENVGWGKVRLPENELHTQAYWFALRDEAFGVGDEDVVRGALAGIANLLVNVAPVYLLCDRSDLGVFCEVKSPFTEAPTIYLYERYAGGVGMSEKLFELHGEVIGGALELVEACPCEHGCPSCVGPAVEVGSRAKGNAVAILIRLARAAREGERRAAR
jgi:DEAD/DEAH box helicase domain-containing protein